MLDIVCLHAKAEVEEFARRNPFLHVYAIGDLDDFFWPHTTWFALLEDGEIRQLVLLYSDLAMRLPTLLAYAEPPEHLMSHLLRGLLPVLPRRFYAHLTQSAVDCLSDDYRIQAHGAYHKMGLTDRSRLAGFDASEAVALSVNDTPDLLAFYKESYPAHWFVPRMLETGFYFGIRRHSELLSVAGVHVYSQHLKVAALGNITTRPDARGQGLATRVTAKLCQELLSAGIECIGLNVKADNRSAIACYKRLGFERIADYGEFTLEAK